MRRALLYSAASILVFALFLVVSAGAADFNVSTVMGLQSALITSAANGEDDIINVEEGIYNVTSTLTFFNFGEGTFSLTIKGAGAGITVMDGENSVQIMSLDVTGSTDVSGITFRNGNSNANNGGGLRVNSGSAATIENCEFSNNATTFFSGGGLAVSGNPVTVSHNTFADNGDFDTYGGGGAEVSGEMLIIKGNLFTGNTGGVAGGMEIIPTGSTTFATIASNVFSGNTGSFHGGGISINGSGTYELVNNIFYDNVCNSGIRDGDGFFASMFDRLTLTNNTFLNNFSDPVTIRLFGTSTVDVYNNIVWDTSFLTRPIFIEDAIAFDGQAPFANVFNNDLLAFDAGDVSLPDNPDNFTSGDNIEADPLFADASVGDVHLQIDSPAIDGGANNAPALPAKDFEGNARIWKGTVDIGADEFIITNIGSIFLLLLSEDNPP